MTCNICSENFNKSNHAPVSCMYCDYQSCRTCCQTFILGQTVPKCMNGCGKEWTRQFIFDNFPKTFVAGPWKKHREIILFDKEIALLPATQAIVQTEIIKEQNIARAKEIDKLIQDLKRQRLHLLLIDHVNIAPQPVVCPCPADTCRGFLSPQWKCGICQIDACPHCRLIKKPGHVCNDDDIASVKLLSKDTKACPSCSAGIFKIDGCNQMWCTQCHTAFSWKTGQIETNIHNPHFYEWQRKNGNIPRVVGDLVCGRELTHQFIISLQQFATKSKTPYPPRVDFIVRSIIHLRHVQLPSYRVDPVQNNVQLRVMYMRNKIDKNDFLKRIQRDNKLHEKKHEMFLVLDMFIVNVTDILYRMYELYRTSKQSSKSILEIMGEIDRLHIYVNTCLQNIGALYACKPKQISFDPNKLDVLINA